MTAFVEVNVIPMDTERVLANQTVLIEGGRITALGPASELRVPSGAVRIDGRGRYLMPGLSDMHTHDKQEFSLRLFTHLAHGVTTIRSLFSISSDHARMLRSAEILSPRVYAPAFTISATMQVQDASGKELAGSDNVAAAVTTAKAAGNGFILIDSREVHSQQKYPIVETLLTTARRLGVPVASHDHHTSFVELQALGAMDGSVEHLHALWGALGGWQRVADVTTTGDVTKRLAEGFAYETAAARARNASAAEIHALAVAAQRTGIWITPTLDCHEQPDRDPHGMVQVSRQLIKALQESGVGLLLGEDDGNVHDELAALVRAGLSPYEALRTGTYNATQYLGELNTRGTVAVGKQADLVLLAGNPLAEIRHAREPAGVMIQGRWLDRAALDQGLLASREWLKLAMRRRDRPLARNITALSDSLTAMKSSRQDGGSGYQRTLQRLADELGAIRAKLPPDEYATFDSIARVWLREQDRQGHQVVISGVALP